MSSKTDDIDRLDGIILRWPTQTSRKWLVDFLSVIATDVNVVAVVAVGSTIRSAVRSDDLDLVVLCKECDRFQYKAPIEVDVRAFALAAARDDVVGGHLLLGWAVKFGKVVFDRDGTWAKLVAELRDHVPLPDPDLAQKMAAAVFRHLMAVRESGDQAAANELNVSYLTFLARSALAKHGVYPASRPELPKQLRTIQEGELAAQLDAALQERERQTAPNFPEAEANA